MVDLSLNKGNIVGMASKIRYWKNSILCITQNGMTRNGGILTRWLMYNQKGTNYRIPKSTSIRARYGLQKHSTLNLAEELGKDISDSLLYHRQDSYS